MGGPAFEQGQGCQHGTDRHRVNVADSASDAWLCCGWQCSERWSDVSEAGVSDRGSGLQLENDRGEHSVIAGLIVLGSEQSPVVLLPKPSRAQVEN